MPSLVLLTGASGFIAFHILQLLLDKGYHVRATVRSQAKADYIEKQFPDAKLEFAIVEDVAEKGTFDKAVKGVDYVVHTASPFHMRAMGLDLLKPAVDGTHGILEAAMKEPKIKKLVLTSSFAAIANVMKGVWPGHVYTEEDWSPLTREQGMEGPAAISYRASKKLAEKTMWDFKEQHKPTFEVASICPPYVFGPVLNEQSMETLNTSNMLVWSCITGEGFKEMDAGYVDVRDVAQAHLLAMEAKGSERYLIGSGVFSTYQMVPILRKHFPELDAKIPKFDESKTTPMDAKSHFQIDNSKSRKLGVQYRDFETVVVDTAKSLIAMGKKEGKL